MSARRFCITTWTGPSWKEEARLRRCLRTPFSRMYQPIYTLTGVKPGPLKVHYVVPITRMHTLVRRQCNGNAKRASSRLEQTRGGAICEKRELFRSHCAIDELLRANLLDRTVCLRDPHLCFFFFYFTFLYVRFIGESRTRLRLADVAALREADDKTSRAVCYASPLTFYVN